MKKLFCLILTTAVLFCGICAPVSALHKVLFGDADGSSDITITDAKTVLCYACGITEPEGEDEYVCDVNFDGEITSDDARLILRADAGIISTVELEFSDWTVSKEPDCVQTGEAVSYCTTQDLVITKELPVTDHQKTQATCTEGSYCSVCGEIFSQPLGHTVYSGLCKRCFQYVTGEPSIFVAGKSVYFGQSGNDLINAYGEPTEILRDTGTMMDLYYYVYADDYCDFTVFTLNGSKDIIGVYSIAEDFQINASVTVSYGNASLIETVDGVIITGYTDKLGSGEVYGIYATTDESTLYITAYSNFKTCEKLVFYLVNSCRALNGLDSLSYSKEISSVALSHSEDMAENNYFSHTNLKGESVEDRLKNRGISYYCYGENIAAGQRMSVYDFNNGWYNSSGHRKIMLGSQYTKIGIGLAYNSKSDYWFYFTEDYIG